MIGVHPLLRESATLVNPITTTLIRRNGLVEEAAETGSLLMFGNGAGSVVRFLGFESVSIASEYAHGILTCLLTKDPLWQPDGDLCITLGKRDYRMDSRFIFETNSERLYSYLKGNERHLHIS